MLEATTEPPPTEKPPATDDSALALLQRMKRLAMLRDPANLVDTVLVSLEMQRQLIKRVASLETELRTLRSKRR